MNTFTMFRVTIFNLLFFVSLLPVLCACTTVAVVGATAGAAVAVTGAAVKTTGAVVGAAIPDGDDEEPEEENEK